METLGPRGPRWCGNRPKGLSRWKGMETGTMSWSSSGDPSVRKDFPGGREWKQSDFRCGRPVPALWVRKDFPGGREWKLPLNPIRWKRSKPVRKDFPGGREWKLWWERGKCWMPDIQSERTFPVEGNGNFSLSFWNCSSASSPKGLSRWKGMETWVLLKLLGTLHSPKGLSRWKGMETVASKDDYPVFWNRSERTFPVEGNGNNFVFFASHLVCDGCPKGLSRWKGMETWLLVQGGHRDS